MICINKKKKSNFQIRIVDRLCYVLLVTIHLLAKSGLVIEKTARQNKFLTNFYGKIMKIVEM